MLGLIKSFLAGIAISLGGMVFLKVGSIPGAVLFTVGLLTVTHYKYKLYTGEAGFISFGIPAITALLYTLLGNVLGCLLAGYAFAYASPDVVVNAENIIYNRLGKDWLSLIILGSGCGMLMTIAVTFARQGKYLPLLFCVPAFICSGFCHCIADAFYIFTAQIYSLDLVFAWLMVVLGNFIGCNIPNLVKLGNKNED